MAHTIGDQMDEQRIIALTEAAGQDNGVGQHDIDSIKIKIATARCARLSYLNYEGNDDYVADIKLHDSLAKMGHWSAFEHCGYVMNDNEYKTHISGTAIDCIGNKVRFKDADGPQNGWSGNFKGFIQYRKTFNNENRTDSRVIK